MKFHYQSHFIKSKCESAFKCIESKLILLKSRLSVIIKKQKLSISILNCNEYFHGTKIIDTRNVGTVCNVKPKPWSHISGPGS